MSNLKGKNQPKPKFNKNKLEADRRVELFVERILDGMNSYQIWRYLTQKTFPQRDGTEKPNPQYLQVTRSTCKKYYAKALVKIRESASIDRSAEIGKALRRYERMHQRAFQRGDFEEARMVQMRIDLLLGLQADIKIDLTATVKQVMKIGDEVIEF